MVKKGHNHYVALPKGTRLAQLTYTVSQDYERETFTLGMTHFKSKYVFGRGIPIPKLLKAFGIDLVRGLLLEPSVSLNRPSVQNYN